MLLSQIITFQIGYFGMEKFKKNKREASIFLISSQSLIILDDYDNEIKGTVIKRLENEIGEEYDLLQQVYYHLQRSFTIEQFQNILSDYVGKKKLPVLAQQLFKLMKKGNTSLSSWKDQFRNQLIQRNSPSTAIDQLLFLADQGNKLMFCQKIHRLFGEITGKQLFDKYEKKYQEVFKKPIEGSKFIKQQNGLKFHRYPQQILSNGEKNAAKTILVLGETGSGKSTLLNTITNYLAGIQINDPFRYQIVVDNVQHQKESVTDKISNYFVKDTRTNDIYRIIDTPGFGDTNGISKDKDTTKKLQKMINQEVKEIHCVIFVMKCSNNRSTSFHRYIFQNIMDLFGKDIVNNLAFVFTFSDSGKPLALDTVKDNKDGFGQYWQQLSDPKYIQVNNFCVFEKVDLSTPKQNIKFQYWRVTMQNLHNLFQKIKQLQGNKLLQTKQSLKQKEKLIKRIKRSKQLLDYSVKLQVQLKKQIQNLATIADKINQNKDFQYQHIAFYYLTQPCDYPVLKCKNCTHQNCHLKCRLTSETVKLCSLIDPNGNCTACDNHCPAKDHFISKQVRRRKKIKIKESIEELKVRYNMSKDQKNVAQTLAKNIIVFMEEAIASTFQYADEITSMQKRLSEICLNTKKRETVRQYLEFSINQSTKQRGKSKNKEYNIYINLIEEAKLIERCSPKSLKEEGQNMIKLCEQFKLSQKNRLITNENIKSTNNSANKITMTFDRAQLNSEEGKQRFLEELQRTRTERGQAIIQVINPTWWEKVKKYFVG